MANIGPPVLITDQAKLAQMICISTEAVCGGTTSGVLDDGIHCKKENHKGKKYRQILDIVSLLAP